MQIDRRRFFDAYRQEFGALTKAKVDGLNTLLEFVESDAGWDDVRQLAYFFATIKHEAGDTWEPIEEYGKGKKYAYGKADAITGHSYYGRGYTQTTWKENYRKVSAAWNRLHPGESVDFVTHPELLLQPKYSYFATAHCMRIGLYTGKSLDDYINASRCDYVNARRIINGLDKAQRIAEYAKDFEKILRSASGHTDTAESLSPDSPSGEGVQTAEAITHASWLASPIEKDPDHAPAQASTGGLKSLWATISGVSLSGITGVWALLKDHTDLLKWVLIAVAILGGLYILRQIVMDAIRMYMRAHPDRWNVK